MSQARSKVTKGKYHYFTERKYEPKEIANISDLNIFFLVCFEFSAL